MQMRSSLKFVVALLAAAVGLQPVTQVAAQGTPFTASDYSSPFFNAPNVDKLYVQSSGSTGDVSDMGSRAGAGSTGLLRTLRNRFIDRVSILEAAKCDGTNETTAIQNFLNAQPVGTTVYGQAGLWCYVTTLNIPGGISFVGPSTVPANPGGSHFAVEYAQMGGLRLENTGTVRLNGASGFTNWIVIRADAGVPMTIPATDGSLYSGVCITPAAPTGTNGTTSYRGADDATIDEVLCIGQSQALVAVETSRLRVGRFAFDVNPRTGTKAAMFIQNTHDTVRIRDVHAWPYGRSNRLGTALANSGIGLHVIGQNDGLQIDGALFINFEIGVKFENTAAVDIGRLWVDSSQRGVGGTKGVQYTGAVNNVNISLLEVWGHQIGVDHTAQVGNHNTIGIGHFDNQYGYNLLLGGGNLDVGTTRSRGTPTDQSVIYITSNNSYLSGTWNDQTSGTTTLSPVSLPTGYEMRFLRNFTLNSPYRPNGTYPYRSAPATRTTIAAPATNAALLLPPFADNFLVTGTFSTGLIAGGVGERKVTLRFNAAGTLVNGTASDGVRTQSAANRTLKAGTVVGLMWDPTGGTWVEMFFIP